MLKKTDLDKMTPMELINLILKMQEDMAQLKQSVQALLKQPSNSL